MLLNKLSRCELLKLTSAAAGTTLLAACTVPAPPAANSGSSDAPAQGADRKTIRWWDNYSDEHPLGTTLIRDIFPVFEEENPGWVVEFTFVTNTEDSGFMPEYRG